MEGKMPNAGNKLTIKAPQTNADRIRSMTDEELADELIDLFKAFYDVEWSKEVLLDWLREDVKDG